MIGKCRCGEIVPEDAEKCPSYGAENEAYRPPYPRLALSIVGGVLVGVSYRFDLPWSVPAIGMLVCGSILQAIRRTRR
jgi:hypothetical protein